MSQLNTSNKMKKSLALLFVLSMIFTTGLNGQTTWTLVSQVEENLIITNQATGFSYVNESLGSNGKKYTLKKSSDGFQSFSSIRSQSGQFGCYTVNETFCIDADTIFISELCQGISRIQRSVNGGQTWTSTGFISADPYLSMFFLDANNGYYSNYSEGIAESNLKRNADVVFTTKKYNFKNDKTQSSSTTKIKFINDSTGFIICKDSADRAVILKTIDFGVSWTEKKVANNQTFKDIHFTSDQVGYVVGTSGQILETEDLGENWTIITSNVTTDLNSIDFSNSNEGYIVGNNGVLLKTTDAGLTWTTESYTNTADLRYVRAFSNGDVFVHDVNRNLYSNIVNPLTTNDSTTELLVYPNPVNDQFHISLPYATNVFTATITNMQGQQILTTNQNVVNLSHLNTGVYFICVESADGNYETRFVKD